MIGNCPHCGLPLPGHNFVVPEEIERLTRDQRQAATSLGDDEARYLVDSYYIVQEDRKRARGQERALTASEEPHSIISWLAEQSTVLEGQIERAIDVYTNSHIMGAYMRVVFGIGPVLTA